MPSVRAVVFPGNGTFEVRTFPMPEPPEGGLLLRVEACGMCGSDLGQIKGGIGVPGEKFPVVPGHEIVGRVERIAPGAERAWKVREGDRVAVDELLRCGRCDGCRTLTGACAQLRLYGYTFGLDDGCGLFGGMSEVMAVLPGTSLHALRTDVPAEEQTIFESLASAVNWVERAGVSIGDTVVIEGPGHQGLACVPVAVAAGAAHVIVTGTTADRHRLEVARQIGATHVIDAQAEDVIARVGEITGRRMADVVMDVTPSPATVPMALALARGSGRVLIAGLKHFEAVPIVTDLVVFKSLTVIGGSGHTPTSMRKAVQLLNAGRIPTKALLGDVVTIDRIDEAMALLARKDPTRDEVRVSLKLA